MGECLIIHSSSIVSLKNFSCLRLARIRQTAALGGSWIATSFVLTQANLSGLFHFVIYLFFVLDAQPRKMAHFFFTCKQEDKDLVHEFVQNEGLACLIRVGNNADQNYQNYILRGKRFNVLIANNHCFRLIFLCQNRPSFNFYYINRKLFKCSTNRLLKSKRLDEAFYRKITKMTAVVGLFAAKRFVGSS